MMNHLMMMVMMVMILVDDEASRVILPDRISEYQAQKLLRFKRFKGIILRLEKKFPGAVRLREKNAVFSIFKRR